MTLKFTIQADLDTKFKVLECAFENNGFSYFNCYGLGLKLGYTNAQYRIAAQDLKDQRTADDDDICLEQVQIRLLKQGHKIDVIDLEDDGAVVGTINLENLVKHWDLIPLSRLMAIHDETDDALDTDIIIQTVAFGEVVYG